MMWDQESVVRFSHRKEIFAGRIRPTGECKFNIASECPKILSISLKFELNNRNIQQTVLSFRLGLKR